MQLHKKWYLPVLFALLIYIPSLKNEFLNWDDNAYITENVLIHQKPFSNLSELLQKPILNVYTPLTLLFFQVEYHFFELNPFYYHLNSLLFHIFNVLLVFFITKKLFNNSFMAFLTSLLMSIHTLQVESVVWVSETKDLLFSFFLLLSLLHYLFWIETKKILFILGSISFFLLSLLAKPQALFYPFVLFLIDFYLNRLTYKKIILEKIPFFLLSGIFGLLLLSKNQEALVEEAYPLLLRFAYSGLQLFTYLKHFISPFTLSSYYPFPTQSDLFSSFLLLIQSFLGFFILVGTLFYFRKLKVLVFCILFYLINIIIVLHLFVVNSSLSYDHFNYIPSIGLYWLFSYYIVNLLSNDSNFSYKLYLKLFLGIYFSMLLVLSYQRTKVWKNDEVFFSSALQQNPSFIEGHRGRAIYFLKKERLSEAIADYTALLKLNPLDTSAYLNRGYLYARLEQPTYALQDYNKYLKIAPFSEDVLINRASAYGKLQKYSLALADYAEILRRNPKRADVYYNRGSLYAYLRDYEKALADFETAMRLNPQDEQARRKAENIRKLWKNSQNKD